MSGKHMMGVASGLLAFILLSPVAGQSAPGTDAIPNFAPDDRTSWFPDRPMGDDDVLL